MSTWGANLNQKINILGLFFSVTIFLFQNCSQQDFNLQLASSYDPQSQSEVSLDSTLMSSSTNIQKLDFQLPEFPDNGYHSKFRWVISPDIDLAQEKLEKLYARMSHRFSLTGMTLPEELRTLPISEIFDKEGLLSNDPRFIQSNLGLKNLNLLLEVTMCASWLPPSRTSHECYLSALDAVRRWLEKSKPTGNPINDSNYINLILAIDLLLPRMPKKYVSIAKDWMQQFINTAEKKFPYHPDGHPNNWRTWNLSLLLLASQIVGNAEQRLDFKWRLHHHLFKNLKGPRNFDSSTPVEKAYSWKRVNGEPKVFQRQRPCLNPDAESAYSYGSFDLRKRDSLHYHMYNIEPLLMLTSLMGRSALTDSAYDLTLNGFLFTKPYVTGSKTYRQWVCTTTAFDVKRRIKGIDKYQVKNWDPMEYRKIYGWGKIAFPGESHWSEHVSRQFQDRWLTLWGALRGERVGSW